MSRAWNLTRQAEAALDEIVDFSVQQGRFDLAETITYLIDPILERIEVLARDGTSGAKSCDQILGKGRSSAGLQYVVERRTSYLIIFDAFDDRIEVIDIVYGGRDLPAYLNEHRLALERPSSNQRPARPRSRQSRGRHRHRDEST